MDLPAGPCDQILARELWLEGRQVSQACVVFLRIGGQWFSVIYDDKDMKWKGSVSKEAPVVGANAGDKASYYWPIVDLTQRHKIDVADIASAREEDIGNASRATIQFTNKRALVLEHRYEDDSDSIRYVGV